MARLAAIYRSSHSPKVTMPRGRYQPFAASPSASLRLLPSGSGRTEPTLGVRPNRGHSVPLVLPSPGGSVGWGAAGL